MYKYYVAYTGYDAAGANIISADEVLRSHEIKKMNEVLEIAENFKNIYNLKAATVTGLYLLGEQQEEEPKEKPKKRKTYAEDFLETFPNASTDAPGEPAVCRGLVYGYEKCKCEVFEHCSDCWDREMEE